MSKRGLAIMPTTTSKPAHAKSTRWRPDTLLIGTVLARPAGRTRVHIADMSGPDRSWVVAGLTRHGLTAEAIADRLDCSLRLIRTIRAEPLTAVCELMQAESATFENELALARSEAGRLARERDEALRRVHLLQLRVERLASGPLPPGSAVPLCRKGLHPMTPYNTYTHSRTGRTYCRECHTVRQRDYVTRHRQLQQHT